MADSRRGGSSKQRDRGRSPIRYTQDRRPPNGRERLSPLRKRRDIDRRDSEWERVKDDKQVDRREDKRRPVVGKETIRFDGALMSESQFHDCQHDRSYKYEEYRQDHIKYNAKQFFKQHRSEEWFIEKYHPVNIVDRRKRDCLESQSMSEMFLRDLQDSSFVTPNYDADQHKELFEVEIAEDPEMKVESTERSNESEMKVEDQTEEKKEKLVTPKTPPPLVPLLASTSDRIKKDLETITSLMNHFDDMRGIKTNVLLGVFQKTQQDQNQQSIEPASQTLQPQTETPVQPQLSTQPSAAHSSIELPTQLSTELPSTQMTPTQPQTQLPLTQVEIPAWFTQLFNKLKMTSEKEQLDLRISYLATVHFHCYYTCTSFPSSERGKVQNVYRSSEKHPMEANALSAWNDILDARVKALLSLDLLVASGERKFAEMIDAFYKEKILKDSPDRFKCELCSKMFKGASFVKKHIQIKHSDKVEEIREKARKEQFYRNYLTHCDRQSAQEKVEPSPRRDRVREDRPKEKEKIYLKRERSPRRIMSPVKNIESSEKNDVVKRERRSPRPISRSPVRLEKRPRSPRSRISPERKPVEEGRPLARGSPKPDRPEFSPDKRGWRGRGRGGRFKGRRDFQSDYRSEVFDFPPPPEFKDKMDPRAARSGFRDLDKPQEDTFDIDYEKALAAFVEGGDS